jgi:hypothetical protein
MTTAPPEVMPFRPLTPEEQGTSMYDLLRGVSRFVLDYRRAAGQTNPRDTAAHNVNMIDTLQDFGYQPTDAGGIGMIALHSLIPYVLAGDENVKQYVTDIAEHVPVDDLATWVTGLGYALGAEEIESTVAESWRQPAIEKIEGLGGRSPEDKLLLRLSVENKLPKSTNQTELSDVLRKSPILDLDIEHVSDAIEDHDFESFLLKSAELMDNLKHRPPRNVASTWRDSIEALTIYAPILELCANHEFASALRGRALEFFYEKNSEAVRKSRAQMAKSAKFFDLVSDLATEAITKVVPQEDMAGDVALREKEYGSYLKKFTEKGVGIEQIVDGIGVRIVLKDEPNSESANDIADAIDEQFSKFREMGIDVEPFDPRSGADFRTDYIVNPKESGYKALHLTYRLAVPKNRFPPGVDPDSDPQAFHFDDVVADRIDEPDLSGAEHQGGNPEEIEYIPFEIQIKGLQNYREENWGRANHLLYKLLAPGQQPSEEGLRKIRRVEGRAESLRVTGERNMLNPKTLISLVDTLPKLKTPLHSSFVVSDNGNLVPKELEGIQDSNDNQERRGLFLPAASQSIEDFMFNISLLDTNLAKSDKIQRALQDAIEFYGTHPRGEGSRMIEDHLLPSALYAATLATASGERWESANEELFIENTVVAALLHDVEGFDRELGEQTSTYITDRYGKGVHDIVRLLSGGVIELDTSLTNDVSVSNRAARIAKMSAYIDFASTAHNQIRDLIEIRELAELPQTERIRINTYYDYANQQIDAILWDFPSEIYEQTKTYIQSLYRLPEIASKLELE